MENKCGVFLKAAENQLVNEKVRQLDQEELNTFSKQLSTILENDTVHASQFRFSYHIRTLQGMVSRYAKYLNKHRSSVTQHRQ